MKKIIFTFLLSITCFCANATKIKIYYFLATTCPISQKYTQEINRLNKVYASKDIEMLLVFPTVKSNKKEIEAFCTTYQITMPYLIDRNFALTKQLNANITPEVFVVNENRAILYHGAINNWYYALGKNRMHITEHYLEDAIKAILKKEQIVQQYVAPIGCFIK
jgi:hypothetical protein